MTTEQPPRVLIVGGGLSGLTTAHALRVESASAAGPAPACRVLEAADRPGGKVQTSTEEGFTCEWGPAGFLDKEPATLELCQQLHLPLQPASDASANRYIYVNGGLQAVALHPLRFIRSPLLSARAKLRLLVEPLVSRRGAEIDDESVASFARRRIGDEAFRTLIDAMQSGIYAGDPERLSVDSCFPRVVEIERQYGSLIRGMVKLMRQRKRGEPVPGAGPTGHLTSFAGGLQRLTDRLAEGLGDDLKLATPIAAIEREPQGGYALVDRRGHRQRADALVVATPAFAAGRLLASVDRTLSALLAEIPYAPLAVVCLGYAREAVQHPLDGFGFLAPRHARLRLLGALFESTIFTGRTPDGKVLIRAMIGGARDTAAVELDRNTLVRLVTDELTPVLGLQGPPAFARVFPHGEAIPQYNVGHAARLSRIDERLEQLPGLFLTGNAYRGIGVNDCVRNAWPVARQVLQYLAETARDGGRSAAAAAR